VILLLLVSIGARAENEAIPWHKDLREASAAAREANKPMMIEFWADWCAPCKIMDAEVYTDARVSSALNQRFIPVRIHFDIQQDLVRQYSVEAIPYLVFTNSYGTVLLRHRGILDANDLTAVIQALPADVSELNRLDGILQKDKNNFAALRQMASSLKAAGLFQSSNEFYGKAVRRDEPKKNSSLREAIQLEMGLNYLELQDGKQAVALFERSLKEFPGSANRSAVMLGLGQAYLLAGKNGQGLKMLDAVIAEFPETEAARKARQVKENR
jgi:thioredoxin-like negative regulator of GroEL